MTTTQKAAAPKQRTCAARPSGPYGIDAKRPCTKPTRRPSAALCEEHEKVWRVEAKRRAQARKESPARAKRTKVSKLPTATDRPVEQPPVRDLAAFATPELAAKAKAKRDAQRAPRA